MTNTKLERKIKLLLEHVDENEKGELLAKIGRVAEGIEYYREQDEYEKAMALASKYHKPVKKLKKEAIVYYKEQIKDARRDICIANDSDSVGAAYGALSGGYKINKYTYLIRKLQKNQMKRSKTK